MYQPAVKRLFDHLQPSQVPNVASLLAQALRGKLGSKVRARDERPHGRGVRGLTGGRSPLALRARGEQSEVSGSCSGHCVGHAWAGSGACSGNARDKFFVLLILSLHLQRAKQKDITDPASADESLVRIGFRQPS